ncbi:MAG: hypothetical protein LBU17_03470 [Treponema sp.]|jgi:hypothetical protein|nr:hypothetical protein [Treponema sp.]
MKNKRFRFWGTPAIALALMAIITLAAVGCSLSLEESADAADVLGNVEGRTTSVPAAFVGLRLPADFLPYFESRFLQKTRTVDNRTRVVVIHNSHRGSGLRRRGVY